MPACCCLSLIDEIFPPPPRPPQEMAKLLRITSLSRMRFYFLNDDYFQASPLVKYTMEHGKKLMVDPSQAILMSHDPPSTVGLVRMPAKYSRDYSRNIV